MMFLDHLTEEHGDSVHIFTDGSKQQNAGGSAAVSAQDTVKYRLNPISTIFTAELYAIVRALVIVNNYVHNRTFTIISDSRSALHAIVTPPISSKDPVKNYRDHCKRQENTLLLGSDPYCH